ncbi:conserved hypothetical protein [Tenacibaculum maritimum]|nr:hypothetical protein [Tenacibaculum maritimum]CAA0156888.1 conserved hypothetical protein [Tenacibaculum maritimum]CAA0170097.1 conserved hypothetical protein [Tenacibaculum maritimum]CAA0239099.1 conserved hypothetical protein [Tenacibaculum maritimum]
MNLRDVLKEMAKLDENKNPVPFSVAVRTFDKTNKKGGVLKQYHGITLMQQGKKRSLMSLASGKDVKNPNHWENKTRNLKVPGQNRPRKTNILFIVKFNGYNVVY